MDESNKSKESDEINVNKQTENDNSSRRGSNVSVSSGSGGSWWGSWINSAKEKTSTVFEAVKNDLDELSNVISTQASTVGAAIENTLKFDENADVSLGNVKKSLSSFFGQVTDALIPTLEYDETETILITHDGLVTLSGFPKHLAELQSNDKTYIEAPEPELKQQYRRWMEVIEQDQFTQDRLAKHLTGSEILNDKYISLVPDKVSHMEFWQRYLFKRALLEDAIANAELAEKRANVEITSNKTVSPKKNVIQMEQPKLTQHKEVEEDEEEGILIGEEAVVEKEIEIDVDVEELENELLNNDITCNVELSEEEQIRLLEEYEQEIQEREKIKQPGDNKEKSNKNSPTSKSKTDLKKNFQQAKSTNNSKNSKTATQNNNSNNKMTPKDDTKNKSQKQPQKQSINQQKGKLNSNSTQVTATTGSSKKSSTIAQKTQKDKEENSSASDESWEKDFDLN